MRLLLTSMRCPKGDIEGNRLRQRELLELGRRQGCDLVLCPEMSLTGYRPSAAVDLADPVVQDLVTATAEGPALCFGFVETGPAGTAPYITQVVAAGGQVVTVHRKAHLGEGEDTDFRTGPAAPLFEIAGLTCSIAVCAEIGTAAPYLLGSRLVLGPAAPGLYGERRSREEDWRRGFAWWHGEVRADAERLLRPGQLLAVSTQAGATDDEDFPGWAGLLGAGGVVVEELPDWREGTIVVEVAA